MERNNKSIFLAVVSGIVACIVCVGVVFLFPTNKSNLKGNENSQIDNEEFFLGDTCSDEVVYGPWRLNTNGYGAWTCGTPSGATGSPPDSATGTTWHGVETGDNTNCDSCTNSPCYRTTTYTRSQTYTGCTSCDEGRYLVGGVGGHCSDCPDDMYCAGGTAQPSNYPCSHYDTVESCPSTCYWYDMACHADPEVNPTPQIGCYHNRYNGSEQIIANCTKGTVSNEKYTDVGTYTVSCTSNTTNETVTRDCDIVKATNSIKNASAVTLEINSSTGLGATADFGTVTYSLTNSGGGAVTLSGSLVTAKKAGTATITASVAGTDNYEGATATITVTVEEGEPACWCNPLSNMCDWRTGTSGWVKMTNISSQNQCNSYSIGESEGCFKKSDNTYVWGNYGATSGYTYVVAANREACLAKNSSGETDTYALRCPRTVLTFGSTMTCTYETNTNETIVNAVSTNPDAATAGGGTGSVVVTAQHTEGTTTVRGITSGGHQTNGVSVTVITDDNSYQNCHITEVKVDQPVVSFNNPKNNPSNSYYIVHVSFMGSGCSKDKLVVITANEGDIVSPSGGSSISGASGQYSYHVYPQSCKKSTPTAKIIYEVSEKVIKTVDTKTGSSVTVLGDWQKSTGCFTPCGDSRCTNGEEYNSALQADLDNSATGPYYGNWNATDKCYNTKWTRNGCGGGRQTYSFCCVANNGSGQSWLTNQTSKTCPEGYTIDNTKNVNTCLKTFACYKDSDNATHWTSEPEPSWVVVDKPEQECKDEEACFEDPTGARFWGKHYDQIANGYKIITSIKDEASCLSPEGACYINNNDLSDYRWSSTPIDGYTKADGINDPYSCQPEACYIDKEKNELVFGKYKNDENYIPIYKTIEIDGAFVDVLITDKTECTTEVPVPPTALDVSKLVYVFMAILMACGIGFIYYSTVAKKEQQQ